jgi:hypothetical protein
VSLHSTQLTVLLEQVHRLHQHCEFFRQQKLNQRLLLLELHLSKLLHTLNELQQQSSAGGSTLALVVLQLEQVLNQPLDGVNLGDGEDFESLDFEGGVFERVVVQVGDEHLDLGLMLQKCNSLVVEEVRQHDWLGEGTQLLQNTLESLDAH